MTISVSGSEPDWRRNQAAVTTATFMGFAGFTLVMPFLPLYFGELGVKDTGAVAVWSGVCLGVTPAITAAMAPVWARLAERLRPEDDGGAVSLQLLRDHVAARVRHGAMAGVRPALHPGTLCGYGPIALTMAAESRRRIRSRPRSDGCRRRSGLGRRLDL
jgi:MFS family permease